MLFGNLVHVIFEHVEVMLACELYSPSSGVTPAGVHDLSAEN